MPLLLYAQISVALLLTAAARPRLLADGPLGWPAFAFVLVHVAVVVIPLSIYFHVAHPAWSLAYAVDPENLSLPFRIVLGIVQGAFSLGIWFGAAALARVTSQRTYWAIAGGIGLALLISVVVLYKRVFHYGSYQAWHQGTAAGLFEQRFGFLLVVTIIGVSVVATFAFLELRRDSLPVARRRASTK